MASTVHYCLALLLAAQISYAAVAPAVYNRTLIVEDLANCPVKSVPFNTNDFDATQVVTLAGVLETSNVTQTCQDAAAEKLINCFVDGEPLNSLAIMTGCCSRACAVALEDSVDSGCFAQYVQAICEDPASESMQLGLSHTAKRCANYDAVCPGAAANATRAANTATAANRDNATAVAARSTQPAATEPAASPAATTPLAPNTNSALSVAAATCAAFVMAAGALVLAMH